MRINYLYLLTVILIYFSLTCNYDSKGAVYGQTLPPEELNSLLWLIRHYGLSSIPQTEPQICDTSYGIGCNTTSDGYHVTWLLLSGESGSNCGIPPSITSFSFPSLELFTVSNPRFFYDYTNPLTLLRNSPNLTRIQFTYDESVTSIPADFPSNMTKLTDIEILWCPLVSIPTFFNNSMVSWFRNYGSTIQTLSAINEYLNVSQLSRLYLEINPTTPQTIVITKKSFPKINAVDLISNGASNVKVYHNTTTCDAVTLKTNNGGYNLIVQNTTNIFSLTLQGKTSTLYPPLNSFADLVYADFQNSSLTTYPFTTFPPKLYQFTAPYSLFTSIPNQKFSSTFRSLGFNFNKLTGPIDWSIFDNVEPGFQLNVENNTGLTGSVPESFCQHFLYSNGTGFTSYPDCYWCFYHDDIIKFYPDIPKPPGFVCNITFDSFNLISIFGEVNITGNNIGWGNIIYGVYSIVPNKILQFQTDNIYYTPGIMTIRFGSDYYNSIYSFYSYNFTILEAGIDIDISESSQIVNGVQIVFIVYNFNPNLNHTFILDGRIPLYYVTSTLDNITIKSKEVIPTGNYSLSISNQYYSRDDYINFIVSYPTVQNIIFNNTLVKYGSQIYINGSFGTFLNSPLVLLNQTNCTVTSINSSDWICEIQTEINIGTYDMTVMVDGYSYKQSNAITIVSTLKSICMDETNNCNNGGQCDINGICVCNPGFYMNNCIKTYPIILSGQYDPNDYKLISIYGDFGPNGQNNPTAQVNGVNCSITFIDQSLINCTLPTNPNYGLVPVKVIVDGLIFNRPDVINFIAPNPSQQECQKSSPPCFGHGQCDSNGECICIDGYNPDDNCLTKYMNGSNVQVNTTTPTASFDIDGVTFSFTIKSIQEISINNTILKELIIDNWIANVTSTPTITNGIYQLNITNLIFTTTKVTAMISFSNSSRDIEFGNQILHINPNSIKISLNITNWIFSSNLSTLRVVFSTTINNQQSIQVNCSQQDIPTFIDDQQTQSLQYLRIVKDNIQFSGRFIDYAISDGRLTFSRTQLINRTKINDDISNAFIGITLPQCRQCILDPDFTPLLIDNSQVINNDCESSTNSKDSDSDSKSIVSNSKSNSKSNNTWKIIVGVVVGLQLLLV